MLFGLLQGVEKLIFLEVSFRGKEDFGIHFVEFWFCRENWVSLGDLWSRFERGQDATMRPFVALRNALFIVSLLVFLGYYYNANLSGQSAFEHLEPTEQPKYDSSVAVVHL